MKSIVRLILLIMIAVPGLRSESGPFLFVFLNTNPNKPKLPKEQVDSLMTGHLANIERLAREGKIVAAGPFYDGGGIIVLATASRDTAWEWLKTDPAVRANRWIIEMFPYTPQIGSVCAVREPYEMVGYGFVRFSRPSKGKGEADSAWEHHLQYVTSVVPNDSIVAMGMLDQNQGSILVTRGEPDEQQLRRAPAVQKSEIQMTMKKLWIARGSFCED
ncbi:MAG: hypothetical protein HRF44_06320 [Ignavibacterium sp.]|jgi:uncharacterized protein YciI